MPLPEFIVKNKLGFYLISLFLIFLVVFSSLYFLGQNPHARQTIDAIDEMNEQVNQINEIIPELKNSSDFALANLQQEDINKLKNNLNDFEDSIKQVYKTKIASPVYGIVEYRTLLEKYLSIVNELKSMMNDIVIILEVSLKFESVRSIGFEDPEKVLENISKLQADYEAINLKTGYKSEYFKLLKETANSYEKVLADLKTSNKISESVLNDYNNKLPELTNLRAGDNNDLASKTIMQINAVFDDLMDNSLDLKIELTKKLR